jgi:multiple sugar transport system ATP-binding protein
MAKVELDKVHKIYRTRKGPVHAVDDLTLAINDGEFVALLGPSGCGKTSTLRMIVGLEAISSGTISFDGVRVNDLSPQQRNVAMAFESYALYPNFTVAENLGFPLEVRGLTAAERQHRVQHMAEVLHIETILEQTPGTLSGGQQQRVGLGRALIREPAVLVLDEVLSHIDAHLKFQMLFDLKRIHQDLGKTTVFVTHDQVEALALADRVAVMSEAQLQQVGTRDVLYHTPANVFVADFIGEPPTNFFTATLAVTGDQAVLRSTRSELTFHSTPERTARLRAGNHSELIVGLRPQNIVCEPGEPFVALAAEVMINEYLGEQTILTLQNGDDEFRALVPPDATFARGDRVQLYYAPQDVMLFDTPTQSLIA